MPEARWLVLTLEAPLVAFGGVAIDAIGVTRDFPAASMLTGLFANAFGYHRTDWQSHQALQDRLVFAARRERENPAGLLTDTQNAKLEKTDKGWTTWGEPEGRDGASYGAPHRRFRDYHMDAHLTVVLRLERPNAAPDLDALGRALDRPVRPLFIGRKPCLPACRLFSGFVEAEDAFTALSAVPSSERCEPEPRALWPADEGPVEGSCVERIVDIADLRNWRTGLHGGHRPVVEGRIRAEGSNAA